MKSTKAMVLGLLCACSSSPSKGSTGGATVPLGVNIDLTGTNADPAKLQAVQMAVADINQGLAAAGAFQTSQFTLVVADSTNTAAVALTNAEAFLDAGVKGAVIDSSIDAEAVNAQYYQVDSGLPLLDYPNIGTNAGTVFINNPNATLASAGGNPFVLLGLQNGDHWFYRLDAPPSTGETLVLMRLMKALGNNGDVNGDGQVVISQFGDNDPGIGQGQFVALQSTAPLLDPWGPSPDGGAYVEWTSFNYTTITPNQDLSSYLAPATQASADAGVPDILFLAAFEAYFPSMLTAYHGGNYTQPVFLSDAITGDGSLTNVGDLAEGIGGSTWVFAENNASGNLFNSEFEAKYQVPYGLYDSQAYDAIELLSLAVIYAAHANNHASLADVQGSEMRDALQQINNASGDVINAGAAGFTQAVNDIVAGKPINYDGASGNCDFDANGNVLDNVVHYEVHNGALDFLEEYGCATDPTCPVMSSN